MRPKLLAGEVEKMREESDAMTAEVREKNETNSLNYSFVCAEIAEQLYENRQIKALPKLTLDFGKGITPDISIYRREQIKPDFLQDFSKFPEMPLLAIEVISASQNIQDLLDKSKTLIDNDVRVVWTVEPFTNTIFVTTKDGIKKFPSQEIESEGIKVDFKKIFGSNS